MNSRKIVAYAVGPIGSGILSLISLPIITWFYSVEDVGRISMLQVITSFSVLVFSLGLDQAYTREYHEVDNKPELLKLVMTASLFLIIIFYSVLFIIKPSIISQWLYDIDSTYLSLISILCFILSLTSRFLSLILRMQERALAYSMSQLLPKIIFLIFILSTVWLGFKKDIFTLITANFLSIITVVLTYLWNTRKDWILSFKYKFRWNKFKPLLLFGLPLVIGGLASWGLNVMDRIFLRSFSTFSELGVYSITMSIATVATLFSSIFNTIWAPLVYKWIKNSDVDLSIIDEISEHLLAAIYFILVFSGLLSWVLPYFLPDEYVAIKYIITLCLIGPLFYTLSETTAIGIAIARKSTLSMLASISAMVINLIGNYLTVPKLGALGAALSTAVAFWFFYIVRTEFSRKVWRNIPSKKAYVTITLTTLTAILSSVYLSESNLYILVWLIMGTIGIYTFRSSLNLLKLEVQKRYAKSIKHL